MSDELPTRDDLTLKTLYCDGYWGVTLIDGVAKLNLYEIRFSVDGVKERLIVGRIAIPIPSLRLVAEGLTKLCDGIDNGTFSERGTTH